ncbi:hypothetical protein ISCGN_010555 [Ixodes scapularis]
MMDDSIEPEVIRYSNEATYKVPPSSQTGAAAAAGAAVDTTTSIPPCSPEETPETGATGSTHPGRLNSIRLQHMKEFFAEITQLEQARQARRAHRETVKEERCQAKKEPNEEASYNDPRPAQALDRRPVEEVCGEQNPKPPVAHTPPASNCLGRC